MSDLRFSAFDRYQKLKGTQRLLHLLRIRITAQRIVQRGYRKAYSVGVCAEYLIRQNGFRINPHYREAVRYRGAPCFRITLIASCKGNNSFRRNISARHKAHSAHDSQQNTQIAVHCGVPAEEQSEITVHTPFFRCEYFCKCFRLPSGDAAHTERTVDIEVSEPAFCESPVLGISVQIVSVFPSVFDDDGDKCTKKEGIRAESRHDVHIRHASRLGKSGIDDDDHLVRVFGELTTYALGIRHLMGNISV